MYDRRRSAVKVGSDQPKSADEEITSILWRLWGDDQWRLDIFVEAIIDRHSSRYNRMEYSLHLPRQSVTCRMYMFRDTLTKGDSHIVLLAT